MKATLLTSALLLAITSGGQSLYFPPNGSDVWETMDPAIQGWCPERIDSLYEFLGSRNTKAFIVLIDGRIVLEHYFGTFTQDSLWYWASAGKTLTSTLVGIAQEEGYLDIDQPTSTYLGPGWTSAPPDKEALITVRNQLTMTSGLDDGVPNDDCTDPSCLLYLADAGTRWAYHNAAYTLLDDVVANSTGQAFSAYFNARIRNPVGMDGFWFPLGSAYNNVYLSTARSMARYGLLALNHMVWDADTILHDADFFSAATSPSQSLNASYGYLWWLNGQSSFMVPGLQFVFPGYLMPDAPADMFNGLGKNDQYLNVVPSRNMVVVRMGDQAYTNSLVPITLANEIWQHINWLDCGTSIDETIGRTAVTVIPNPCEDHFTLGTDGRPITGPVRVIDTLGRTLRTAGGTGPIDVTLLAPGTYVVRAVRDGVPVSLPFIKR